MLVYCIQLFFFQQFIVVGNYCFFQVKFLFELLFELQVFIVVIVDGDGNNVLFVVVFQQVIDGGVIDFQFVSNLCLSYILFVIELGDFDN